MPNDPRLKFKKKVYDASRNILHFQGSGTSGRLRSIFEKGGFLPPNEGGGTGGGEGGGGVTPRDIPIIPQVEKPTLELLVDSGEINGGNLLFEFFVNNGIGFHGTFDITNQPGGEMSPISFQAKLAYNNVDITSYITIASGATQTLTVPIGLRLPEASSYLQFKVIFGAGVQSLDPGENFSGFTSVSSTENPYTEENTLELLVDSGENSVINGGNLTLTIVVSS